MTIEETLYSWLAADTQVQALVGDRIYPGRAPTGAALPLITYQRVADRRWHTLVADTAPHSITLQVTAWAQSYAQAATLAERAAAALRDRADGTVARLYVDGVGPDLMDDGAQAYGRVVEATAWTAD